MVLPVSKPIVSIRTGPPIQSSYVEEPVEEELISKTPVQLQLPKEAQVTQPQEEEEAVPIHCPETAMGFVESPPPTRIIPRKRKVPEPEGDYEGEGSFVHDLFGEENSSYLYMGAALGVGFLLGASKRN